MAEFKNKNNELYSKELINEYIEKRNKDYDYKSLEKEYEEEIQKVKSSNDTLNFTEINEDESAKEAVKSLIAFDKLPRNCTKEEISKIGLGAVECFFIDVKNITNKTRPEQIMLGKRILKVVLIWFCIYLAIAIPCWCQKGWCCCCCRCKFCRPLESIDEAKKFLVANPIGTYNSQEDGEVLFEPSVYEKQAQKKLEHVLMRL